MPGELSRNQVAELMRWFTRKNCPVPTLRGLLVFLLAGFSAFFAWSVSVHNFLCVNKPVPAKVLVAESWLRDDALQGVVEEFKRGYTVVITPGSTPPPNWAAARYGTIARFAAASLAALGIDTNSIVAVPGERIARDRTFASAVAVREWLKANFPSVRAINVYSMGPHARRTRLLYERAFGRTMRVGIISHPERSYNPRIWWTTMEGTRDILSESLAYLYVKFFFWGPSGLSSKP